MPRHKYLLHNGKGEGQWIRMHIESLNREAESDFYTWEKGGNWNHGL